MRHKEKESGVKWRCRKLRGRKEKKRLFVVGTATSVNFLTRFKTASFRSVTLKRHTPDACDVTCVNPSTVICIHYRGARLTYCFGCTGKMRNSRSSCGRYVRHIDRSRGISCKYIPFLCILKDIFIIRGTTFVQ